MPSDGERGKPGGIAHGTQGGKGGEGGRGGKGIPPGSGGHGGEGGKGAEGVQGPPGPKGDTGEETWRSKAFRAVIIIWIVIFTFAVGYSIHNSRESVDSIRNNKASLVALQKTNCGLKKFLLTAYKARLDDAKVSKGDRQKSDLDAAKGYLGLASSFRRAAIGRCVIPNKLQVSD